MTERWQQELQKLRSVRVPAGMHDRIAEGPTGSGPMPRTRQRILAGVVAFGVFAAAAAFAVGAFNRTGPITVGGPEVTAIDEPTASPAGPPVSVGNASDILRVRCHGERAEVLTPVVRAHPDGLHALVQASPEVVAIVQSSEVGGIHWTVGYWHEDGKVVQPVHVGDATIYCDQNPLEAAEAHDHVPFQIVAGSSRFVPYAPQCHDTSLVQLQTPEAFTGQYRSAEEAVRGAFPAISTTDVVEHAGYVEAPPKTARWFMRVVRDGRIIAWVYVSTQGESLYFVMAASACEDALIGTPLENQNGGGLGFG